MVDLKDIKNYWDTISERKGNVKNPTINDWFLRDLEIEIVKKYLKNKDKVLDIGCGNGDPTLICSKFVKHITGIDYSKSLIRKAKSMKLRKKVKNVDFIVGNALTLPFDKETFDAVIVNRVLINIPQIIDKHKVIDEAIRVLKIGGLLFLTEATIQGHERTNAIREKYGIEELHKHWHNVYVDEKDVASYFKKKKVKVVKINNFSMYMFISKLLYPLINGVKKPLEFTSRFNEVAALISKNTLEIKEPRIGHIVMWVLKK